MQPKTLRKEGSELPQKRREPVRLLVPCPHTTLADQTFVTPSVKEELDAVSSPTLFTRAGPVRLLYKVQRTRAGKEGRKAWRERTPSMQREENRVRPVQASALRSDHCVPRAWTQAGEAKRVICSAQGRP